MKNLLLPYFLLYFAAGVHNESIRLCYFDDDKGEGITTAKCVGIKLRVAAWYLQRKMVKAIKPLG